MIKAFTERLEETGAGRSTEIKMEKTIESCSECPITDLEMRYATYNALSEKLSLVKDYRENLLSQYGKH